MPEDADAVENVASDNAAERMNVNICREVIRSGVEARNIDSLPFLQVKMLRNASKSVHKVQEFHKYG